VRNGGGVALGRLDAKVSQEYSDRHKQLNRQEMLERGFAIREGTAHSTDNDA